MKRLFLFPAVAALSLTFLSCGKQQSEAERNAEVDRQVQQRLDAEHQAAAQQKLDQRQADLDAREQAVAAKESATPAEAAAAATAPPNESEATTDSDSSATFYRKLDPYGDWIETSTYGFVFQPRVAAQTNNWRPYTNGHWVYTDAGWTWISDEKFGWATYHYGRWTRLRSVGWVWVPGDEWAPAWVSWRKGNDFVGWAPLPPDAHFDRQSGIRNSVDSRYDIGPQQYNFVPANEFGGPQSSRVVVPAERNVTIINQTTNVTNITYNNSTVVDRGLSYDDLHARSRYPIQRLRLERSQNMNDERPVIRGQVVAMPARDLRPAQRSARPPRIQRTIQQPVVERGREANGEGKAAPEARATMQPEAKPTASRAPQAVVRPTPVATPTTIPPARMTPRPAPPATATPAASRAKPAPPKATSAPQKEKAASPNEASTPAASPSLNPRQAERRKRLQERRAKQKAAAENSTSPTSSASPTATETPARKNRHPGPQPNQP